MENIMTGNPLLNTQSNFKVKRRYHTLQKSCILKSVVEISNNIDVQCWLPVGGCEKILLLANGLELDQGLFRSMEVLYTQVLANRGAVYNKIIIYCPLISFQILCSSY